MISQELMAIVRREFALDLDGIHGLAHWERVCENGLRLAQSTGANTEVVELFAFLHDVKRRTNGHDPGHGRRAADLIRILRGSTIILPEAEYELLLFACVHHTDGLTQADVTVQTCWDADRLDLGRVGIEPDPRHLCTPQARDAETIRWAFLRSL